MDERGIENIRDHESKLAKKLVDGIKDVDGVIMYYCDSLENHLSTISVNVEGIEAMNTGIMLDVDWDIATRTGLHCAPRVHQQMGTIDIHGTVRFSIGAFNTEQHVDTAIEAIRDIAADRAGKR